MLLLARAGIGPKGRQSVGLLVINGEGETHQGWLIQQYFSEKDGGKSSLPGVAQQVSTRKVTDCGLCT